MDYSSKSSSFGSFEMESNPISILNSLIFLQFGLIKIYEKCENCAPASFLMKNASARRMLFTLKKKKNRWTQKREK